MTVSDAPSRTTCAALGRTATVLIQGVPVQVPCPSWCTVDHAAENLAFLEDLHHAGNSLSLPVTQYSGAVEHILVTQVCQWPYEGQHGNKGQPYLSIDADGSGECNGYAAAGALALIDQLVTHAEAIRQQLRTLGSIQ